MNARTMTRTTLTAAAAALLLAAPAWAGAGTCLSVEVPGGLRLPDGSLDGATRITLCPERSLSPVTGLYKLQTGGVPRGIFQSRIVPAEEGPTDPYVLFRRAGDGRLVLVGFVLPGPRGNIAYHLMTPGGGALAHPSTPSASPADGPLLRVPALLNGSASPE